MPESQPALGQAIRSAAEIAGELRRGFEAEMQKRHGTLPLPDPVLATLFHTLGVQVARVYEEAERVFPVTVLDDLVDGLGMPPRLAQPAQTVVRFAGIEQREAVGPETQLYGFARTGEQIGFAPDEVIELAPTTLAFAGVYEAGRLHALTGARVPGGSAVPPGSVPLALDAAPTLYLAFDADEAHLSGLGVFVDADPVVARALERSPWQLLGPGGCVSEEGMLRAHPGRAGVRRLAWFRDGGPPAAEGGDPARVLALPDGLYGAQVWVFPPVPPRLRHRCGVPPGVAGAAALLMPEEAPDALDRPLAWVQVPLPAGVQTVADRVHRVEANCVTASNVEVWSEQVPFDRIGSVVTLRPEGSLERHVMGVLSVIGERGDRYAEESAVDAPLGAGRWRYRDGRLELRPAWHATRRSDSYAMARLLLCDGAKGNGLEVGAVCRIDAELANVTVQVANLTVSRGGSPPPDYHAARLRFAELLRTRERVVTAADVEIATRAFEPRVARVEVESLAIPDAGGVARVERVTARVRPRDFADPEAELPRLRALLEEHLRSRVALGHEVRVRVEPLA
ncbi:MAG TPA: hypothetical protein VHG28_22925 [Longimicrobiaceae bacterium]|nr:hypothetical protein [Longimicrobiaceae bacterium]